MISGTIWSETDFYTGRWGCLSCFSLFGLLTYALCVGLALASVPPLRGLGKVRLTSISRWLFIQVSQGASLHKSWAMRDCDVLECTFNGTQYGYALCAIGAYNHAQSRGGSSKHAGGLSHLAIYAGTV